MKAFNKKHKPKHTTKIKYSTKVFYINRKYRKYVATYRKCKNMSVVVYDAKKKLFVLILERYYTMTIPTS